MALPIVPVHGVVLLDLDGTATGGERRATASANTVLMRTTDLSSMKLGDGVMELIADRPFFLCEGFVHVLRQDLVRLLRALEQAEVTLVLASLNHQGLVYKIHSLAAMVCPRLVVLIMVWPHAAGVKIFTDVVKCEDDKSADNVLIIDDSPGVWRAQPSGVQFANVDVLTVAPAKAGDGHKFSGHISARSAEHKPFLEILTQCTGALAARIVKAMSALPAPRHGGPFATPNSEHVDICNACVSWQVHRVEIRAVTPPQILPPSNDTDPLLCCRCMSCKQAYPLIIPSRPPTPELHISGPPSRDRSGPHRPLLQLRRAQRPARLPPPANLDPVIY